MMLSKIIKDRRFFVNPQAVASVSKRKTYEGHPDLGNDVDRDTWLTPRWVLDSLGIFDLDPCAAANAPEWAAQNYFLKTDNGLSQEWRGRVFMNPPFSDTAHWLERHAAHGLGISLVPAAVESNVWRKCVWPNAKAIFLTHGRMRFCNPDGSSTTGRPLRSIALIAWTAGDAGFFRRSKFAGTLLETWGIR